MIDDLDRSLEELLRRTLPPSLVSQIAISFLPPDNQFPPEKVKPPAIDLFLYDIRENRDLRSAEPIVERRSNGATVRKQPPVRVDCSYLITAWASPSSTTPSEDEHRLLGEVMLALLRHSVLPPPVLRGSLAGAPFEVHASAAQSGQLQSLGEFWQALGGKPKAALHYTLTIAVEPQEPEEGERAVIDSVFRGAS